MKGPPCVISGLFRGLLAAAPVVLLFCPAALLMAQLDAEFVKDFNEKLANDAVCAVEVFSAGETVSAGTFRYDNDSAPDAVFHTTKVPGSHGWKVGSGRFSPFVEGYISFFSLDQKLEGLDPSLGRLRIRSLTFTAGGGIECALADRIYLMPRMAVAYSHVWEEVEVRAGPGDPLKDLFFDWEAGALTILPSLETGISRSLGPLEFGARSRYTVIRVHGLHDTSDMIDLGSDSRLWRNEMFFRWNSLLRVMTVPVTPYLRFARYDLYGYIRRADFTRYFYELRFGFDVPVSGGVLRVHEAGLNGAYYFHGPLTGYSIGVRIGF